MLARVTLAVIAVLALGAGGGFAAGRLASSGGTTVCVNDTNGLMRAASTCRDGEHSLTIGGGNVQATQNGIFSVAEGETSAGKALPLTGVTVSARCESVPGPFPGVPDGIVGRLVVQAASGATMQVGGSPAEQTSQGIGGFGVPPGTSTPGGGTTTQVLTSNGATATITAAGFADPVSKTCSFLWQAVEASN
jgi:hypothetical protein